MGIRMYMWLNLFFLSSTLGVLLCSSRWLDAAREISGAIHIRAIDRINSTQPGTNEKEGRQKRKDVRIDATLCDERI